MSQTKKYTDYLSSDVEKNATNKVSIDPAVWEVFQNQPETDFFKFQEVRKEYVVRISLVKNGRVFKKIKCNIGYFTLIAGSKPYDYQEVESEEKKATRQSLFHPCFEYCGVEFMAVFNEKNKHYKALVDMIKF